MDAEYRIAENGEVKWTFLQRVVYAIAYVIAFVSFRILMPTTVHGDRAQLRQGPCLYYSNHISLLDPFLTHFLIMPKRVFIPAKTELFKNKVLQYMIHALGAISIDRGNSDLGAMKSILDLLKKGQIVSIYPEGTRTRHTDLTLGEFQPGIAMIAHRSGVPIIPVYFDHGNRYRIGKRVNVYVGEALDLSDYQGRKIRREDLESITKLMQSRLNDLRKSKE